MIRQADLISKDYRKVQSVMHRSPRGYGRNGDHWAPTIIDVAQSYGASSILDYGAGEGRLAVALRAAGYSVREYDPGIKLKADLPDFADLVTCCDVMEHVEPDKINNVLAHIRLLARKAVFMVIACRPANTLMPNGGNAHLTIQGKRYWRDRLLAAGFTIEPPPTVLPEKMPRKCWMGVLLP